MHIDFSIALKRAQQLISQLIASLPNLVIAIGVLVIFVYLSRLTYNLTQSFLSHRLRSSNLGFILGRLLSWVVITIGVFVALSVVIPSLSVGDLVQLLGITGVAVGFAFRDIFQNFLAGILLLLTQPFSMGDRIAVKGFEGIVEDIQTRATRLRTAEGERVVIPNATLFTESVVVRTAYARRRMEVEFSTGLTDVARARSQILEAIREVGGILPDPPPQVLVTALSDTSITIQARWWIDANTNGTDQKNEVLERIQSRLKNTEKTKASTEPQK